MDPSTITEMDRSKRREQSEEGKLKKGSLEIKSCQSLSKAIEIRRITTLDSSKSCKENNKNFGKDITGASHLVKAMLMIDEKSVRLMMLNKDMGVEERLTDFGYSISNRTIVGTLKIVNCRAIGR